MSQTEPGLGITCLAEVVGTFLLVFIGCGAVHTATLLGALPSSWQVGSVWGFAVALAIHAVGKISGAHINPAVTVAMAFWDGFPWRRVLPYIFSQVLGAALAALALYAIFHPIIHAYELEEGIVRGTVESIRTATMYGEYYPNPGVGFFQDTQGAGVGTGAAFLAEFLATGVLSFGIFALTDSRNIAKPGAHLAPLFIGMTVAILIAVFGPVTQACLNPARDFGPRFITAAFGWGRFAFEGTEAQPLWGTLAVYLLGPITGAVLGGAVYVLTFRPRQPEEG